MNSTTLKHHFHHYLVQNISYEEVIAPLKEDLVHYQACWKSFIETESKIIRKAIVYLHRMHGKLLRPIMVLTIAKIYGQLNELSYKCSTMIETIHIATLIHDDVVDNSSTRRNLLSFHKVWKNKFSVLLGDYLALKSLSFPVKLKRYDIMDVHAASMSSMVEGEIIQHKESFRKQYHKEIYFDIIRKKTAYLYRTCCQVGLLTVNKNSEDYSLIGDIGLQIGIAFQIKDDILDYTPNKKGKPSYNDFKNGRATLPFFCALESATKREQKQMKLLLRKKRKRKRDKIDLIAYINKYDGIEKAKHIMYDHAYQAFHLMEQCSHRSQMKPLINLIAFILTRAY